MGAKHHHVFAPGPGILFAEGAQFHQLAEQAFLDRLPEAHDSRPHPQSVSHSDLESMLLCLREQFIGLGRSGDERFFAIDMRAGPQRCQRDGVVLVGLPHRDAHQVGSFLFQHLAIVGVAAHCADSCCGSRAALGIRIG